MSNDQEQGLENPNYCNNLMNKNSNLCLCNFYVPIFIEALTHTACENDLYSQLTVHITDIRIGCSYVA